MFVSIIEKFWSSKVEGTLGLGGGFFQKWRIFVCVSRKCECIKMRMCCFEIFEQYFNYNIIADFFSYSMAFKRYGLLRKSKRNDFFSTLKIIIIAVNWMIVGLGQNSYQIQLLLHRVQTTISFKNSIARWLQKYSIDFQHKKLKILAWSTLMFYI